jgi:hypothetical protein
MSRLIAVWKNLVGNSCGGTVPASLIPANALTTIAGDPITTIGGDYITVI